MMMIAEVLLKPAHFSQLSSTASCHSLAPLLAAARHLSPIISFFSQISHVHPILH
jgi:hypothetical protein